jgi:hypothetical protein
MESLVFNSYGYRWRERMWVRRREGLCRLEGRWERSSGEGQLLVVSWASGLRRKRETYGGEEGTELVRVSEVDLRIQDWGDHVVEFDAG